MRARFAQAAECSPCVLLLRHVDALAQNAQVQESGKGAREKTCQCYKPVLLIEACRTCHRKRPARVHGGGAPGVARDGVSGRGGWDDERGGASADGRAILLQA